MKKKFRISLHTQILIGLILGAVFGSVFHINQNEIEITASAESRTVTGWKEIRYLRGDSVLASFEPGSQPLAIKFFKSLLSAKASGDVTIKITNSSDEVTSFTDVKSVSKIKSLGVLIKPAGDIFIRLLNMIAVPLVLASLIVGAASLSDLKHVAKVGGKTIAYYMTTTVFTITTGLILANIIKPGLYIPKETGELLMQTFQEDAVSKLEQTTSVDVIDFLVNLVPRNPFKAIADGDFLQIVFYAVLTGLFLTQIPKDKSKVVISFFEGISGAMIVLVEKVMYIAPFAVFALISATVAEFGISILQTLFVYSLTVVLGLILIMLFLYPAIIKIFTKHKVTDVYRALREVMVVAFSTSSSAATLPLEMEVCEKKLGVPNKIASFVLPLGATINMDGTALYQAVASIFIAQVYGFDLSLSQQLTIIITAVLASIGTAPVPGVGLIMLIIVLRSVGVPQEGIALILGVDRFLDMCRTVPNIISDTTGALVIAKTEGVLGSVSKD